VGSIEDKVENIGSADIFSFGDSLVELRNISRNLRSFGTADYLREKLNDLGFTTFLIANSEGLLRNPRDLIDIIVNIRKTVNPNAALYFPFADPYFVPLLSYMGVDFFGEFTAEYYAYLNIMLTSNAKYDLKNYQIYDLNQSELEEYNKNSMDFVVREVRENIKNGTLRNLVEERCCTSPEAMTALRLLDKNYSEFLDNFTHLY
jgi:predicted RNA-binding protein